MLKRNQKFQMFVSLILALFMLASISFAQTEQDEELKKKFAPILGEYEFDLTDFGAGIIFIKFHIDNGALWAESGLGSPFTLEQTEDESFEFTSDDPDSGALEIKFSKDDKDQYTICQIAILDQGVEITGTKIEK